MKPAPFSCSFVRFVMKYLFRPWFTTLPRRGSSGFAYHSDNYESNVVVFQLGIIAPGAYGTIAKLVDSPRSSQLSVGYGEA